MKIIVALIAFASFSAFACPKLSGEYDCSGTSLKISHSVDAWGFHTYELEKGGRSDIYTTDELSPESDIYTTVSCGHTDLEVSSKVGITAWSRRTHC